MSVRDCIRVLIARSPVSVRVAVASVHEIREQRRCHTQCEHLHASHRAEPMRVSSHEALSSLTEILVRLPASPRRGERTPPAMAVPWHWHGDASASPILPSLPPWYMHRMHWGKFVTHPSRTAVSHTVCINSFVIGTAE